MVGENVSILQKEQGDNLLFHRMLLKSEQKEAKEPEQ